MERKEGADNVTGRLDNVDWCRGLILPGLSDYADCRCRPMSELPSAPTATVDQLREGSVYRPDRSGPDRSGL